MSEHQFVAFRAIDRPVSKKNLEYMRRQSTRAEITSWEFSNEYDYGDFHGDTLEMLRRGYDLHLHYANFGIRKLLIRFPDGLPEAAKPYLADGSLEFVKDKQGRGGVLSINPFLDPDDLEELWDLEPLPERLAPLRGEMLDGDLRPLYIAHLAITCDSEHDPEETTEAPVPAGLKKPTDAQQALMEFLGLSDSLIAAASRESPPLPKRTKQIDEYAEWLQGQPEAAKNSWLANWMSDANSSARADMLAEFRKSRDFAKWPAVDAKRTIAELQAAAEDITREFKQKAADKAARERAKRLAAMAADPEKTLRETEKLVRLRSTNAYSEIAVLLADLREALAGSEKSGLAESQARKLKKENPTLRRLTAELRRKGFVPK